MDMGNLILILIIIIAIILGMMWYKDNKQKNVSGSDENVIAVTHEVEPVSTV